MPKKSIVFILLWLSAAVFYLSGCQNSNTAPAKFGFKDERSMREALRGTWILKEYEDSIDAGLTPKLLSYMMTKLTQIDYDSNRLSVSGFGPLIDSLMFYANGSQIENSGPIFDFRNNKIFFTLSKPYSADSVRKDSSLINAEFIFNDSDTILRVHMDSTFTDFIKYPMSCDEYPYYHLINSKFIAGKYYLLNDTGKTHHILFSKCGAIEGSEFIDNELKGYTSYSNGAIDQYYCNDVLVFEKEDNTGGHIGSFGYLWQVVQDSLILRIENDRHTTIVLVHVR